MERYTKRQVRLLLAMFIAYTAAYISRTNLSPALDAIQADFGLSYTQVGLLPTLFALPYAAGQIINGSLVDRFSPRRFILAGLLGTFAMNVLFSFAPSYPVLLAAWFLNGCVQSMIWTPIVRTLATEFGPGVRDRATFLISMTLIAGYLAAWALSGFLTGMFSWRIAFRAAGITTGVIGVLAVIIMGRTDSERGEAPAEPVPEKRAPVMKLLFGTDILLILACCVFNGYVRDGIMNWGPKILMDTQGIDLSGAVGVILVIPVINFIGIQIGKRVFAMLDRNSRIAVAVLLGACSVFSLMLTVMYHLNVVLCAALLAFCSAMAYGVNPLLTSVMPMDYREMGRVGMAAGLIDALIYVGSAFSGAFAGAINDRFGWQAVFASWVLFSACGAVLSALSLRRRKRLAGGK